MEVKSTTAWSAGVVLAASEVWQCIDGAVQVTTEVPVSLTQGFVLRALDSMSIPAGLTVYHRAAVRGSINREAIG